MIKCKMEMVDIVGSIRDKSPFNINVFITNSDLNRPCFAWHPYWKPGLFKTELVIGQN